MGGVRNLSFHRLNNLADAADGEDIEAQTYNNGDILFKERSSSNGLFFIERGTILLTTLGADGSHAAIRTATADNFIGFLSLVRGTNYTSTAMAIEDDCQVRFVSKAIFNEALTDNSFANGFIKILCERIQSIENHIVDLKTKSVRQRLAIVLIMFENAFKKRSQKESPLISLKKKDIARIVGTAPETLSRHLAEFENEGFIELHIKGIKVINHPGLYTIANISD